MRLPQAAFVLNARLYSCPGNAASPCGFTGTSLTFSGMHDFNSNKLNPDQPTLASLLKK